MRKEHASIDFVRKNAKRNLTVITIQGIAGRADILEKQQVINIFALMAKMSPNTYWLWKKRSAGDLLRARLFTISMAIKQTTALRIWNS